MKRYIGALDQGTTSTRFALFDHRGRLVSWDQKEHTQYFPQPGWVEHDPWEIWENSRSVMTKTFLTSGISPSEVAGLGVTNQRETVVLWDRHTGEPLHRALVWQDTRTEAWCRQQAPAWGPEEVQKSGLPLTSYFSATKLAWLLEHVPEARQKARQGDLVAGTIDSWLLWNLTGGAKRGVHATDATNASRTLLMNLKTLTWDQHLAEFFDIPLEMLPTVNPSAKVLGLTEGLEFELPVASLLGDQQAALFGQAGFARGDAKNTYGTGAFLLMNTGEPAWSSHGLLTTVAFWGENQKPVYGLEGSVAVAGAGVQWLRDNLGLIKASDEIEALARSVPDNGGVYLVPAFSGLLAPYWRQEVLGIITGLTRFANKGHIARAVLEAVAYQTRDVVEAMEKDAGTPLTSLKVDGGMTANDFFLQFQAEILGVPVRRPVVAETTALGAAFAAGLAVGFWKDQEELSQLWSEDRHWVPQGERSQREAWYAGWKAAVNQCLAAGQASEPRVL